MRPILYLWIFPPHLSLPLGFLTAHTSIKDATIRPQIQILCDLNSSVIGQYLEKRHLIGQSVVRSCVTHYRLWLLFLSPHLAPGGQITAKNIQINTICDSWCAKWKLFLISLLSLGSIFFLKSWIKIMEGRSVIGQMVMRGEHCDGGCRLGARCLPYDRREGAWGNCLITPTFLVRTPCCLVYTSTKIHNKDCQTILCG